MSHDTKESSVHPTHPPFCRGVKPPTKFSKKGRLDRTSTFTGRLLGKKGMTFFQGGWGVAIFT